ncbi:MAG: hypothetical protein FJW88_04060 [Actinobacteria bacterium]|nr:hypothetical protein [Actinomycetota bacterium]
MNRRLARFLRRRGATPAEVERAVDDGWLVLLTLDRMLLPGASAFTANEMAARAGVDRDFSKRLWRALGFPDVPDDVPIFTREGLDALRNINVGLDTPFRRHENEHEALVGQVRAISAGLARVAEVFSDELAAVIAGAHEIGMADEDIAAALVDSFQWDRLAALNDYALRLQVRAALWRKLAVERDPSAEVELAVGFLDLVGYTAISQELEAEELSELVARFEAITRDTVAELGGRVVKMIGDEVMYVAEEPRAAVEIVLRLTERAGGDAALPDARAGVDFGPVVGRDGDYYGPVVNLAHRLVEVARPGTVLVSGRVRDAVGDDPAFDWSRMRVRRIRDIGRVESWSVRPGDRVPAPER